MSSLSDPDYSGVLAGVDAGVDAGVRSCKDKDKVKDKGTPELSWKRRRGIEDMDQLIIMALALAAIITGGWALLRHR